MLVSFSLIITLPVKVIVFSTLFLVLNICILVEITQNFIPIRWNYFIFDIIFVCFFRKLNLWININRINIECLSSRCILALILKFIYNCFFNICTSVSDDIIYFLLLCSWEGIKVKIKHFRKRIVILTTIYKLKMLIWTLSRLYRWLERKHSFLTTSRSFNGLRYLSNIERKLFLLETFALFNTRILRNSMY